MNATNKGRVVVKRLALLKQLFAMSLVDIDIETMQFTSLQYANWKRN